jgi:hypothetical protein
MDVLDLFHRKGTVKYGDFIVPGLCWHSGGENHLHVIKWFVQHGYRFDIEECLRENLYPSVSEYLSSLKQNNFGHYSSKDKILRFKIVLHEAITDNSSTMLPD